MTHIFDTYSRRSTAYRLTEISEIIFILFLIPILVLQNRLNNILSSFWTTVLISVFVLSLICFIAGFFIRIIRPDILMYIKDGELEIDSEKLILNSKTYNLSDINDIELKVIGYRGQAGSRTGKDGTGNKFKIHIKSNQVLEKSFVLNTREQFDNLKSTLMQWEKTGLKIKVDGFDLR